MKAHELDWSLADQIDQHRKEQAEAEWQEKVDAAKKAGNLEAKIIFWLMAGLLTIAALIMETPH